MIIRTAKMEDLTALTQIGQACYVEPHCQRRNKNGQQ